MANIIHKPGDQQRLEIVAALSYLLNCCDSQDKPSSGAEFLKYAKEKFDVEIDRKRVPNLFQFLYYLTEHYELPFKINAVFLPINTKYWASRKGLNTDDLVSVITAIKNDSTISKNKTQKLIEKILNFSTNEVQRELVKNKEKSIISKTIKNYNPNINFITEIINDCYLNNKILNFKLHKSKRIPCSSNIKLIEDNLHGNVLSIIYDYDELKACIYTIMNKTKLCMIVPYSCIEITNLPQENLSTKQNEYLIDNTVYQTAFDWLANVQDHNPRLDREVIFNISNETSGYNVVEIAKTFRSVFNKESMNGVKVNNNGKEEIQVKVTTTYSKFREFMLTNNTFMHINVIEPRCFNEMIMCPIVETMLSKISCNGEAFDFELTRKFKDSYVNKHKGLCRDGKTQKTFEDLKVIFKS